MALQFQPYANPLYGEELKQKQFDNLNQTLQSISQEATQRRQFGMEMALKQAQNAREQGTFDLQNGPLINTPPPQPDLGASPFPGGSFQQQNPDPAVSNQPEAGGFGTNPQGPQNRLSLFQGGQPQPQMASDIVARHKAMYPHLDPANQVSPTSAGSFDPEKPYLDALYDPNTSPAKADLIGKRLSLIGEEEKKPYEMAGAAAGVGKTQSETQKNLAEAKAAGGYSPQDMADIKAGNWNGVASRYGGTIPSKLATMGESTGLREDQMYQTKLKNAQDALIQVRGDQAISRTETQRDAAIQAYKTIEDIKNENRMPSQLEYYDLLGQMWKARTGSSPSDQAIKDLDAKTFHGDLGRAAQYFTGSPAGVTTKAILDNIQNFAAKSGLQADQLHEGYMAPRLAKITMGLKPEDQASIMSGHRGLSFQEATGYKSGGGQPMTATNKQTGQKIQSLDGGKTWQVAQ